LWNRKPGTRWALYFSRRTRMCECRDRMPKRPQPEIAASPSHEQIISNSRLERFCRRPGRQTGLAGLDEKTMAAQRRRLAGACGNAADAAAARGKTGPNGIAGGVLVPIRHGRRRADDIRLAARRSRPDLRDAAGTGPRRALVADAFWAIHAQRDRRPIH